MEERYERRPPAAQDGEQGGRSDHRRAAPPRSRAALVIARRRPVQEPRAEHQPGLVLVHEEGAVGQAADRRLVVALGSRSGREALGGQLEVDRVGADLAWMELAPDLAQTDVVGAAAERAGPMTRREGGRLVEEEELGELARLKLRAPLPAAELEPARDPAARRIDAADAPAVVVQAAAVAVEQAARGIGDQLGEGRHTSL